MSEKYISELKITESDIKKENDKERLKSFKLQIESLLIELKTAFNTYKSKMEPVDIYIGSVMAGYDKLYYKQKVCQYFLSLISQRQNELNEERRRSKELQNIQEDKEIILELRNHVSKEIFLDIVRKVKDKLNLLYDRERIGD